MKMTTQRFERKKKLNQGSHIKIKIKEKLNKKTYQNQSISFQLEKKK